jgi:hypothetical protein
MPRAETEPQKPELAGEGPKERLASDDRRKIMRLGAILAYPGRGGAPAHSGITGGSQQ